MNRTSMVATFLTVFFALSTGAQAQNTYRCGNSYSQTPCPGGVPVNVDDSRSKEQKAATDAATRRDLHMADSMEKTRLQQEEARRKAALTSAEKPSNKNTAKEKPAAKQAHGTKKHSRTPEYFTARTGKKIQKNSEAAAPASPPATTPGPAK